MQRRTHQQSNTEAEREPSQPVADDIELVRTKHNPQSNPESMRQNQQPALEIHAQLQRAFEHFNKELFEGRFGVRLSDVVFTTPRSNRFKGYFQQAAWVSNQDSERRVSEIAINPAWFHTHRDVCATLTHEMGHQAQAEFPDVFGRPGKGGYHNKAFARMLSTLGLPTSSTGKPGGDKTGVRMSHYIVEDGAFLRSYERFEAQQREFTWTLATALQHRDKPSPEPNDDQRRERERAEGLKHKKRLSKTKYTCENCQLNAWAKPNVRLICGTCEVPMVDASDSYNAKGAIGGGRTHG